MEELEMKINEFKENNETKKEVMDQKMEALKLENINSMRSEEHTSELQSH